MGLPASQHLLHLELHTVAPDSAMRNETMCPVPHSGACHGFGPTVLELRSPARAGRTQRPMQSEHLAGAALLVDWLAPPFPRHILHLETPVSCTRLASLSGGG